MEMRVEEEEAMRNGGGGAIEARGSHDSGHPCEPSAGRSAKDGSDQLRSKLQVVLVKRRQRIDDHRSGNRVFMPLTKVPMEWC